MHSLFFHFFFIELVSPCVTSTFKTPCSKSGKFSVFIEGTPDCEGSFPLVIRDLDCKFKCEPGYYSEIRDEKQICSPCPAGTFSISGVQYGAPGESWEESLKDLKTEAWTRQGQNLVSSVLPGWRAEEGLLRSVVQGSNETFGNLITFSAVIVKPGSLGIRYKKDSVINKNSFSKNGVFTVFLNRKVILKDFENDHAAWKFFEYGLDEGLHEIILEYSASTGFEHPALRATVSTLFISGSLFADVKCYSCPAGGTAEAATSCETCGFNQYWSSGACENCPKGTFSFRGSVSVDECIIRKPCLESDYEMVNSSCKDGMFNQTFRLKEPCFCDEEHSQIPRTRIGIPCVDCLPGSSWAEDKDGSKYCSPCKLGTFKNGSSGDCESCPSGTISQNEYKLSSPNILPPGLKTFCLNNDGSFCHHSNGWLFNKSSISTDSFHPRQSELILQQTLKILSNEGWINLDISLSTSTSETLNILVDQKTIVEVKSDSFVSFELDHGEHLIEYVLRVEKNSTTQVILKDFNILGSDLGGGTQCKKCEIGTYSKEAMGTCMSCPAGQTSDEKNEACVDCPSGSISKSEICTQCPSGTRNNHEKTQCIGKGFIFMPDGKNYFLENITRTESKGICTMPSSSLYCVGNFYGPLPGDSDFYISILNPGFLYFPNVFPRAFDKNESGYSFMIVSEKQPSKHSGDSQETCTEDLVIKNLGKDVGKVQNISQGISFHYYNGDFCGNSRYSTNISLICDIETGIGWPSFVEMKDCTAYFLWKSKYGCPICKFSDMKTTVSECKDGIRAYKKVSTNLCILPFDGDIEYSESCSEVKELMFSKQIILAICFLTFLLIMGVLSLLVYCKYKKGYDRLKEEPDSKY